MTRTNEAPANPTAEGPRFSFMHLPWFVHAAVVEHLVFSLDLDRVLMLRLVNRLFDREILRALVNTGRIHMDAYPELEDLPTSLAAKILVESVKADRPPGTHLLSTIRRMVDRFSADEERSGQDDPRDWLSVICSAASRRLRSMRVLGLLHPNPDIRHGEAHAGEEVLQDQDKDIYHGLTIAAYVGDLAQVRTLLGEGLGANVDSAYFGRPLHAAAQQGHHELVRLLLEHGARPNGLEGPAVTPLREAAAAGHERTVRVLLEGPSRPPSAGPGYERAVTDAVYGGHANVLRYFLDRDRSPDPSGDLQHFISIASTHGYDDIVRLILDRGFDVNARLWGISSVLSDAAGAGHASTVRLLLERGADVHEGERKSLQGTALAAAAARGRTDVAQILLDAGVDVNAGPTDRTALGLAAEQGLVPLMRLVLDHGADLDAHKAGQWGLSRAAAEGHEPAVRFLIERGVDPNVDRLGEHCNPMLLAKVRGHEHVVQTLRELGAEEIDPSRSCYAKHFASSL